MIRINLAANYSKGQALFSATGQEVIFTENEKAAEIFKRLIVIALIPAALYVVELQTKPAKEDAVRAANKRLEQLNVVNSQQGERGRRLQTLQSEIVKYDERWNLLKQILQSRTLEIKIIEQLQEILPDQLWFNKIQFENKKLLLTGGYLKESDYEEFYKKLTQLEEFFLEAIPNKVNSPWASNTLVKEFELQIELVQSTYAEDKAPTTAADTPKAKGKGK